MEFLNHRPSEFDTDYLLSQYQKLARVSKEIVNGQIKYRFKPVDNALGIWISEASARSKLEEECEKHQNRLRRMEESSLQYHQKFIDQN